MGMTLVFVETPDLGVNTSQGADYVATTLAAQSPLLAPVPTPDLSLFAGPKLEVSPEEDEVPPPVVGSDPEHVLMFGRYVGQIDARIQRAWLRPRTSIVSGSFFCRVRIAQERSGHVQEIEILKCNDDPSWQLSLVHAIQSASPLPAPPDPGVFRPMLTLEFSSPPYSPGEDAAGFEPERRAAVR
jgi:hypothetical protein